MPVESSIVSYNVSGTLALVSMECSGMFQIALDYFILYCYRMLFVSLITAVPRRNEITSWIILLELLPFPHRIHLAYALSR